MPVEAVTSASLTHTRARAHKHARAIYRMFQESTHTLDARNLHVNRDRITVFCAEVLE